MITLQYIYLRYVLKLNVNCVQLMFCFVNTLCPLIVLLAEDLLSCEREGREVVKWLERGEERWLAETSMVQIFVFFCGINSDKSPLKIVVINEVKRSRLLQVTGLCEPFDLYR